MDETTVREIMTYYFKLEKSDVKAMPKEGSGPDFLQAGRAIELKGTNSDFSRAIQQFIDYLLTGNYQGLSVAFPHDLLDAGKMATFVAFCQVATAMNQSVPTYILTEDETFYYVRRFNHGKDVWTAVLEEIYNQYYKKRHERDDWQMELAKKAPLEFKNFSQTLRKNLHQLAKGPTDSRWFMKSAMPHVDTSGAIIKGFSSEDTSADNRARSQ